MDQSQSGTGSAHTNQEQKQPAPAAPALSRQHWDNLARLAALEIRHTPGYSSWPLEQRKDAIAKRAHEMSASPHYQAIVRYKQPAAQQPTTDQPMAQESHEPSQPAPEPLTEKSVILKTNSEGNPPQPESIEDYLKRLKSKDVTSTGRTIGITGMKPRSTTIRSNKPVEEEEPEPDKGEFNRKEWIGMSPTQILQKLVKTGLVKDATNPGTGLEIVGTSQRRPREYEES